MPTLKNLVDEVVNIENEIVECRDALKQILLDKNIQGLENENSLSTLINKANELKSNGTCIYYYGDEKVGITGGWIEGYKLGDNPTFTKNVDSLQVKANGTSTNGSIGLFATSKSLNLTQYKAVKVIASIVTPSSNGYAQINVTSTASTSNVLAYYESELGVSGSNLKFELNISSVSSGHVRVGVGGNTGNTMNIKIHEVWLES